MTDSNPFGKWTIHRARIAALSRSDAHNAEAEAQARQLLIAARLADQILAARGHLTPQQHAQVRGLL